MRVDELLADRIVEYMQLDAERVFLSGFDSFLPEDEELFIVIGTGNSTCLSNQTLFDETTNEEVNVQAHQATLYVDVISKNEDAYNRKEEILGALKSFKTIKTNDLQGVGFFRRGDYQDLSLVESANVLKRFRLNIIANYTLEKRINADFYDTFRTTDVKAE